APTETSTLSLHDALPILNGVHRHDPPLSSKLAALSGVHTLFIQALDDPELAAVTRDMFLKAPEPRDQAIIPHGNFVGLSEQEKRSEEHTSELQSRFDLVC